VAYRATKERYARADTKATADSPHNDQDPVSLTEYWPHNELDLVADMLYENSTLSIEEIRTEVAKWPYQQKVEVISAYMGERLNVGTGRAEPLKKLHYHGIWSAITGYFETYRDTVW